MADYYFDTDDLFGLKAFADFLEDHISNCGEYKRADDFKSYVIALDASWGMGKTQFLMMFKNYLCGKSSPETTNNLIDKNYSVIYYNAWENDFWNNAFEPLADTVFSSPEFYEAAASQDRKAFIDKIKKSGWQIAKGLAKGFIVKSARDIAGEEASDLIKEGLDNIKPGNNKEEIFPEYKAFKKSIQDLGNAMTDYINSFEQEKRLVIIVDELDRCKPLFAIETLEIVKHIFNVEGLTFIFAMDIEQLEYSVSSVYGQGMNSAGYLLKLFNMYCKLTPPDYTKYFEQHLFRVVTSSEQITYSLIPSHLPACFQAISTGFKLSLRDIDTVLSAYKMLYDSFLHLYNNYFAHVLYFLFLTIKYKLPGEYRKFFTEGKQIEKTNDFYAKYKKFFIASDSKKPSQKAASNDKFIHSIINALNSDDILSNMEFEGFTLDNLSIESKFKIYKVNEKEKTVQINDEQNSMPFRINNFKIDDDLSLSGIIYKHDLLLWEEINRQTARSFLYSRLEKADFNISKYYSIKAEMPPK